MKTASDHSFSSTFSSSLTPSKLLIGNLGALLVHSPNSLQTRLSALASLSHIASSTPFTHDTHRAVLSLSSGLYSSSPLIRQKSAYALSQSRYPGVVTLLQDVLRDRDADVGLRVEAARGLGEKREDSGDVQSMVELLKVRYDEGSEELVLREASEVAAAKLGWMVKGTDGREEDDWFGTIDFAPPLPASDPLISSHFSFGPQFPTKGYNLIPHFAAILSSPSQSLFVRSRALTSLRNLSLKPSPTGSAWSPYTTVMAILQSLTLAHSTCESPYLRIQILTAIGQINYHETVDYLKHIVEASQIGKTGRPGDPESKDCASGIGLTAGSESAFVESEIERAVALEGLITQLGLVSGTSDEICETEYETSHEDSESLKWSECDETCQSSENNSSDDSGSAGNEWQTQLSELLWETSLEVEDGEDWADEEPSEEVSELLDFLRGFEKDESTLVRDCIALVIPRREETFESTADYDNDVDDDYDVMTEH